MIKALSRVFLGLEQIVLTDGAGPLLYTEGSRFDDDYELGWKNIQPGRFTKRVAGMAFGQMGRHEVIIENLPETASEGQGLCFEVGAAARADKRARVKIIPDQEPVSLGLEGRLRAVSHEIWGRSDWEIERHHFSPFQAHDHDEHIDEARQLALSSTIGLKGGGVIHLEPTRAVLAIDIDSADYQFQGPKALRIARINEMALQAAIRHCRLMGMGGRIMLDLVSQYPNRQALKSAFDRAIGVEKGTQWGGFGPFGSLEYTRSWRTTPLSAYTKTETGGLIGSLMDQIRLCDPNQTNIIINLAPSAAQHLTQLMKASHDPLAARLLIQTIS